MEGNEPLSQDRVHTAAIGKRLHKHVITVTFATLWPSRSSSRNSRAHLPNIYIPLGWHDQMFVESLNDVSVKELLLKQKASYSIHQSASLFLTHFLQAESLEPARLPNTQFRCYNRKISKRSTTDVAGLNEVRDWSLWAPLWPSYLQKRF